jgi:L-threonine kinase
MEKVTYYPGSVGEIIQGKAKNMDLLLSCPVNLFTCVRIYETKNIVNKFKYPKANRIFSKLLERWDYKSFVNQLDFEITSDIPIGKGFASSTADLCAVYYGLIKLLDRKKDAEELIEECIKIEPTDSIVFDKLTLFDYKYGKYHEVLGNYMEYYLLVYEGNKCVDTLAFNALEHPPLYSIDEPLELVREAVENNDLSKLGEASTMSILNNQHRLYYDSIDEVIRIKEITGGLGILGGHSGDVLSIIYEDYEKLNYAHRKYKNSLEGYRCYTLKSLRSVEVEYENYNDYSSLQW